MIGAETELGTVMAARAENHAAPPALDVDFRVLLECAPDAMVITNHAGAIALVNAQAETLFGYPRGELLGEHIELLVPEVPGELRDGPQSVARNGRALEARSELRGRRRDGFAFPIEITLSQFETAGGAFVLSAIREITSRRRADADAAHFAAVVASSRDAIISKSLDGIIRSWNAGAEQLYGYPAEEAIGQSIAILVPAGCDDEVPELLRRVGAGERLDEYETVRVRKDGTQVEVSLIISPIRDAVGAVTGASTIARDISARRRYEEQLRFLADHDALTGARNRRQFERDLGEQMTRARWYGEHAALLIIDVDNFKQINDNHGHRTGDRAMKLIAQLLARRLRATDLFARIGGDEFAVLLPYASETQALAVCRGLRSAIGDSQIDIRGAGPLELSISVGHAIIDESTESEEVLFNVAESRMYREKAAKHHRPPLDPDAGARLRLAGGTDLAIAPAQPPSPPPTPVHRELKGYRETVATMRRRKHTPNAMQRPSPERPAS